MAITYESFQVVYKNHCTPQEQILSGGRFYLDSDCRRKLTGSASVTVAGGPGESGADSGTYNSSTSVSTSAVEIVTAGSDADFVYIKNTGTDSVSILITFYNSLYYSFSFYTFAFHDIFQCTVIPFLCFSWWC